jgi:hypothetical protein
VILLETTGGSSVSESIIVFRSSSFEAAFPRAIEIGHQHETEYIGGTGERVRWRLKEIATLDLVQSTELDGAEVYHQLTPLDDGDHYGFDYVFQPELSKPAQTI